MALKRNIIGLGAFVKMTSESFLEKNSVATVTDISSHCNICFADYSFSELFEDRFRVIMLPVRSSSLESDSVGGKSFWDVDDEDSRETSLLIPKDDLDVATNDFMEAEKDLPAEEALNAEQGVISKIMAFYAKWHQIIFQGGDQVPPVGD